MNSCGMTLRASCILSACICLITSLIVFVVVGVVGLTGSFEHYLWRTYNYYGDLNWLITVWFFFLQFISNPILIVGAAQESSSAILVWLCLQSIHITVLIVFVLFYFIFLLSISLWGLSVAVILPGILLIGIDIVFVITAGRSYRILKNGGSLIPRSFNNNVEYAPQSIRSNSNFQRSSSFAGQLNTASRQDLQWRRGAY